MLHILVIGGENIYKDVKTEIERIYKASASGILIDFNRSQEIAWESICRNPYRYDAVMIDIGRSAEGFKEILRRVALVYNVNKMIHIIFLTGLDLVPRELCQVPHVFIIGQPVMQEDIRRAMEQVKECLMEYERRLTNKIIVKHGKILRIIPQNLIIYGKKSRYGMTLVTEQEEIPYCRKLEEFADSMGKMFCRCHSSYIVNFRHVIQVEKDYMILDTGENIAVSRSYRKSVYDFVKNLGCL